MAPELSSNWKKLQAKLKAESSTTSSPTTTSQSVPPTKKRKADVDDGPTGKPAPRKKPKPATTSAGPQTSKPPPPPPPPPSTADKKTKPPKPMGAAHSQLTNPPTTSITPSLSLWAAENAITPESLAEAYSLGLDPATVLAQPAHPNAGLSPNITPGKYLAIDCEMVGIGPSGADSALARVSIVDFHGRQLYDSYVRPTERVTDWRTHVSGIAPRHMASARSFAEVREQVSQLVRGRILVGHDLRHDLAALELTEHPSKNLRDTARFAPFRRYGHGPKPALRVLAAELLGVEIQKGQHSSVEDARVAMLLFRKHKSAFDVDHANRFPEDSSRGGGGRSGGGGGKKKKKKSK